MSETCKVEVRWVEWVTHLSGSNVGGESTWTVKCTPRLVSLNAAPLGPKVKRGILTKPLVHAPSKGSAFRRGGGIGPIRPRLVTGRNGLTGRR